MCFNRGEPMTLEENLNLREDISNLIFLLELTNDSLCDENIDKARNIYKAAMKQFRQIGITLDTEVYLKG